MRILIVLSVLCLPSCLSALTAPSRDNMLIPPAQERAPVRDNMLIPPALKSTGNSTVKENLLIPTSVPISNELIPEGPPALPKGAVEYSRDGYTQAIAETWRGRWVDTIDKVPIGNVEAKWHVSGGMQGIRGWTSTKYRVLPEGKQVKTKIGNVPVWNGANYQYNRGIVREYPDGTEFIDVLKNDQGVVFEYRVHRKENGKWLSSAEYSNEAARPKGYTGLKQTCASCHNEAGTGKYGAGLVPGGDHVISDPLDWRLINAQPEKKIERQPAPQSDEDRAVNEALDRIRARVQNYAPTSFVPRRGRSGSGSC